MSAPPQTQRLGPSSLLQTEARQRAQQLAVTEMKVELDLTAEGPTFSSRSTLTFDCRVAADAFVDFRGEELRSAVLNGRLLDPACWQRGRIPLTDLHPHNVLVVDGVMAYSNDGEGLYRHVDQADQQPYLYAMSFLDAAPRWFACFDQPDLKARYLFDVRAPVGWTVLGNGPSEELAPGRWRLRAPRPLSTYFVTLVAGPYVSVRDEHDGIPLGFHARASQADALAAEAADLVAVTKGAFDYYHRVFGLRYPFGEYHQAFVPDFNAGAMENPGCVVLRDQLIFRGRATASERAGRATTMAHEMAHMWFGDLVTMRWWDELWLNESFAEYIAHRACEEGGRYRVWTEFGIDRKDWGSVADQSPSTHPVAGNGALDAQAALNAFDGISYAKGAAVLQQLVAHLGDDVFFAGLRRYFSTHAYGNADFADLTAAWTAAGATGLEGWSSAWLHSAGMDVLRVDRAGPESAVVRVPPAGEQAARTHALQVGAFDRAGRLLARTPALVGDQPVPVPVPAGTALVVPDSTDQTWARLRLGPQEWSTLGEVLPQLGDATTRVVLFNAVRDAVRNAELAPARALDLLCAGVLSEGSDVVLASVLAFALSQLAGPYAAPADRAARRQQVHATARTVLEQAPAGSDHQLAAFRLVLASCDDVDLLQSWLASSGLPHGVELDRELSWALVRRVTSLSGDGGLIEATLARDPSGSAPGHAAQARAGLPSAAAKEAAWRILMSSTGASAYEAYATAQGFFDPAQSDLTEPYVDRYFEEVPQMSTFRHGWSLGKVALLAYPSSASTPQTLSRAQQTLVRGVFAAPVERALVDGTDRLRRAVASRRRYDTN